MKNPMKFKQKTKIQQTTNDTWKILIVDDEKSVHEITKTVLEDVVFNEKKLEFLSAYSAKEAEDIISKYDDVALILLDVVMENDHAGLNFVDFVRDELKNKFVRIILRTGQPGVAPHKEVVGKYGINDYKEKTDLSAQKLYTTVVTSLRNYKELKELDAQKVELMAPKTSNEIYEISQNLLNKLINTLVQLDDHSNIDDFSAMIVARINGEYKLLAKTPNFNLQNYEDILQNNEQLNQTIQKAFKIKSSFQFTKGVVNYYEDERDNEHLVYINCNKDLSQNDIHTVEMFAFNFSTIVELYIK